MDSRLKNLKNDFLLHNVLTSTQKWLLTSVGTIGEQGGGGLST